MLLAGEIVSVVAAKGGTSLDTTRLSADLKCSLHICYEHLNEQENKAYDFVEILMPTTVCSIAKTYSMATVHIKHKCLYLYYSPYVCLERLTAACSVLSIIIQSIATKNVLLIG